MKNNSLIIILLLVTFVLNACNQNRKNEGDMLLGKKIDFMLHSSLLYNIDSCSTIPTVDSNYKIVTYCNLYCEYCWDAFLPWKEHLKDFETLPGVSFFCYIASTPMDFDDKNTEAQLNFPVYLDTNERFKIVNNLGNDPTRLSFLLNDKNEVIIVGQPFSPDMKQQYLDAINKNEK